MAGATLFIVKRPWIVSVPRKRFEGAFFCGTSAMGAAVLRVMRGRGETALERSFLRFFEGISLRRH
jgi:hypothetical protein